MSAKPFHQNGMDFERAANVVQNKIRAKHEMPPLSFDDRHTDYFSWFNAVGKVLENIENV